MKDNKFIAGIVTGAVGSLTIFAITIFIVVLVFGKNGKTLIGTATNTNTTTTIEESEEEIFNKIKYLTSIIDTYSLYDIDDQEVVDGIYQGIFDSIGDTYSEYYTAKEYTSFNEQSSGEYCGIGAYIGQKADTGSIYISSPMKGSPAEEVGLRAGDIIYKVDDHTITDEDTDVVVSWIKGEEGTDVTLMVVREGEDDYLTFSITRKKIEVPTVEYEVKDDNIGYISVTSFDTVTTEQFKTAITDLSNQGVKGLIIDLRSNPGGMLSVVVDMLDMFLPKDKMIVYTEDKEENVTEEYKSQTDKMVDLPMVVMINGYSASASEIFAGAVQDYKLGTLLGTTSFGKGIVQTVLPLGDGSAVKLTTAKYFTPNGRYIHEVGIEPDIEFEFDSDSYYNNEIDNQLDKALEVIKEKIN